MRGPQVPEYMHKVAIYVPGKPVEEVERELGVTEIVKLASNENPLGSSPKALAAVEPALPTLNRYPDGGRVRAAPRPRRRATRLTSTRSSSATARRDHRDAGPRLRRGRRRGGHLAAVVRHRTRSPISQVNGNGRSWCRRGRPRATTSTAMAAAVTARTKLIYIANPCNPTGTYAHEAGAGRVPGRGRGRRAGGAGPGLPGVRRQARLPDGLADLKAGRNVIVLQHLLQDLRPGGAAHRLRPGLARGRSPTSTACGRRSTPRRWRRWRRSARSTTSEWARYSREHNLRELAFLQAELPASRGPLHAVGDQLRAHRAGRRREAGCSSSSRGAA